MFTTGLKQFREFNEKITSLVNEIRAALNETALQIR